MARKQKLEQYVRVGNRAMDVAVLYGADTQAVADMCEASVAEVEEIKQRLMIEKGHLPLPAGYKVWYEYGTTWYSPTGRNLRNRSQTRCVTAHLCRIGQVTPEDAKPAHVEVATGKAVCNPKDQFRKDVGRRKALGRALAVAGLS